MGHQTPRVHFRKTHSIVVIPLSTSLRLSEGVEAFNAGVVDHGTRDTPLRNITGLDTSVYAQLRGEGYSKTQIGAAAGDLSKVRGFTPTDVSHYTPYFVETSKKFRDETKRVIESNGTKKFEEGDSVTEANAQAELHGGHKIEHQQMNSLGQLVYDSGINRETLRRQPGEAARRQFFGDHMRKNFNGFEYEDWKALRGQPDRQKEYERQHGVQPSAKPDKDASIAGPDRGATQAEVRNASDRFAALATKNEGEKPSGDAEKPSGGKSAGPNAPSGKKEDAPDAKKTPEPTKEASARQAKPAGPSRS
jgi:hypothetical protein